MKGQHTNLDDQNPKQGPIPNGPKKLSRRGMHRYADEYESTIIRTMGAALKESINWTFSARLGVRYNITYILAISGGIGGRADIVQQIAGKKTRQSSSDQKARSCSA